MELLERVQDITLDDNNKYFLDDTCNDYEEYLNSINELDASVLESYLETLKDNEKLDNHINDIRDLIYLTVFNRMERTNSLEEIIKIYKEKGTLSKEDLILIHRILMYGTNNLPQFDGFRGSNDYFVGAVLDDGTKRIDYIPESYTEIEKNVEGILNYLNSTSDNPFIKPFIVHGLLSVLQPFEDGNTRLSRLVQHGKIWTLSNELYDSNLELPALYLSKNYNLYYGDYRKHQMNLVKEKDNKAWNRWIRFNLNMVNEQLYFLNNNVEAIKRSETYARTFKKH